MDEIRAQEIGAVARRAVVLVEGISDQIAVETLAARLGRHLDREGIAVVPMGGAHAIGRFLTRFGAEGLNARLAGLYDVGEERVVQRGFKRSGFSSHSQLTRTDMERLGFYVCIEDLEDELIRALGAASVQALLGIRALGIRRSARPIDEPAALYRGAHCGQPRKNRTRSKFAGVDGPGGFRRANRHLQPPHGRYWRAIHQPHRALKELAFNPDHRQANKESRIHGS